MNLSQNRLDLSQTTVQGSNPPQLVSKQATMDALNQKVKSIQQREQEIERRFEETSKLVDRSTLGAVADFPVNDEGQIYVAGAEAEMEQLQQELNHFYTIDDQCGGRSQRVWAHYLSVAFPWMAGWCINSMLLALLMRAVHHRRCGHCWLQYIEFFCGQGNLSKQALRKGWQGVSLDQEVNQSHDLLEPHGLELWLLAVTATIAGALVWMAPPCSSFVILCKAQSQRYPENNYMGDTSKLFVLQGNCLAELSSMLLLLAWLLRCRDGLEQPSSSVFPELPSCQAVLRFIGSSRTTTYHYLFGGPTLKPLQLWSSRKFMKKLHRERPPLVNLEAEDSLARRGEDGRYSGCKERLVESQVYSPMFGQAIVEAIQEEWFGV